MWQYRKAILVNNSSGSSLTDFQISISIGTSALIASGKMQTDCDDIRITDINGNLLPYWIEENNPGCNAITDTKIWLKANSLPTSGATIYIYYGNSVANNYENGDNVFEFFDDFNDINKTQSNWTATGTGFTVTGGSLYHSTTLEPTNSFPTYTMNNSSGFTNGTIESRMKPASCGNSYGKGLIARYTNDNNEYIAGLEAWTGNYTHVGRRVGGSWTNIDQDILTCDINTWYQLKWNLNGTNQLLLVNGVASSGVDASFSSGKIGVHIDNRETPTGAYWDYIFVRKFASSEPLPSMQSEETGTAPIAYWKFDEGVGTTAYDSIGNNNGVINKASWNSQGLDDKSLNFSPNQESLLLDYKVWKTGQTGSITGFSQNGSTSENSRVLATDPFGRNVAIWQASQNDITSDADGGWNSSNITIDQTKTYRFSTWIRRTILGNGTYYFGTRGLNSSGTNFGILNRTNGAINTNPYFRSTSGNEIYSSDSWFLLVGHVWPVNSGTGPAHSDTGLYNSNGTKIATPIDFVWQDGTSYTTHRSYLYYSTDSSTVQQWAYPRIDIIDGTEPSIQDLLDGHDSFGADVSVSIQETKESFSFWYDKNSTGNWQHIAKSSSDYYVNGKPDTPEEYPIYVSGDDVYLGRTTDSDFVTGSIDEVKIYNYTRTAEQIKQDYNSRGSISGSSVNLGVQSNTTPNLKSSLFVYYKFDENNGTTTYNSSGSGDGIFGTGSSAPNWSNGKINNAISFQNDQYISINDSNLTNKFSNSSDFSISTWINTSSSSSTNMIIGQQRNTYMSFYLNNFRPCLYLDDGGYCTTTSITSNNWQHLVATYKGSDESQLISFYLNGTFIGSGVNSDIAANSPDYLYIGYESRFNYSFNGIIDEIKIYNKVLLPEEIKQDYNQSSVVQFGTTNQTIGGTTTSLGYCIPGDTSYCASPIAEWKFEENTGTLVKDTSGNNNNGTFGTGNSAPNWSLGQNNKGAGLNFDGINNILDIPDLTFTGPLTYSFWINSNSADTRMWFSGNSSQKFGTLGGKFFLRVISSSDNTVTFPSLNNWHFITLTRNSDDKVDLYINGNQPNRLFSDLAQTGNTYFSLIGSSNDGSGQFYQGKIDNIKIYNYARTPAQIAYDYNRGAPVGWWKLDECQGLTAFDSSGLGNTGIINIGSSGSQTSLGTCAVGTSAAWTNGAIGKINSSLSFDGIDDYLQINEIGTTGNTPISLSLWANFRSNSSGDDVFIIYGKDGTTYQCAGLYLRSSDNYVRFTGWSGSTVDYSTGFIKDYNVWHHWTLVYNGSTVLIYRDGIPDPVGYQSRLLNFTLKKLLIGGGAASGNYTDTKIDDVQIYNYALTAEQVKLIHNGGAINFR